MTYMYRIERGQAWLNKGDDKPLKNIGKFSSDALAKAACERHYTKACKMARAANRIEPTMLFF